VREGEESFSIMGFGSIRGLSKFTADEVAEMGFDTIWSAYEGGRSGYEKLQGKRIDVLYRDLKARGVAILSSMIIGFPYQDPDLLEKEFGKFIELEPGLWQILIYFAFPGTPLYRKALDEDRYLSGYRHQPDYRTFDGFSMHFKHDHFTPEGLEAIQKRLYRRSFELLGPSLVRVLKTWFGGYQNLKTSPSPVLKRRAQRLGGYVRKSIPGIYPAIHFGPNRNRREEARRLFKAIIKEFGPLTMGEKMICGLTVPLSLWTWVAGKLGMFQQPRLLKIEHRF
jgi:hypothetical protein